MQWLYEILKKILGVAISACLLSIGLLRVEYAQSPENLIYEANPIVYQNNSFKAISSPLGLIEGQIYTYATQYSVSYEEIYKTIECESNFNTLAVGDFGKARGISQFWESTFDAYNEKYFNGKLEYDLPEDQVKLMAKMFSEGEEYHWSCWKHLSYSGSQ